jgi:hypothetical protein
MSAHLQVRTIRRPLVQPALAADNRRCLDAEGRGKGGSNERPLG